MHPGERTAAWYRLAERLPGRARLARIDPPLYAVWAASCTLLSARVFFGSLHEQTGGTWSAPLDDVFIHFDYARAIARGAPFEWSHGSGYSSGNTSLTYPFALAIGYLAGFRDLLLMQWAAIVACVSLFAFLLCAKVLFRPLGAAAKYLLPPALFLLGGLAWSLWSGMEVALLLAAFGACLLGWEQLASAPASAQARRAWALGALGAFLVATRPEAVTTLVVLGLSAACSIAPRSGARAAARALARVALPSVALLFAQALANRAFTGEWAANGAISKLIVEHPLLTYEQKWGRYEWNLRYALFRPVEFHFADREPFGWLLPAAAALPLFARRTRRVALTLWAAIAAWVLLVAMNGQLRWQNERYLMPAVAWLVVLGALGVAVLLSRPLRPSGLSRAAWALRAAAGAALALSIVSHQLPRLRDQVWFFGRASRNIRDQHLVAGGLLRHLRSEARRVLVGDAGALIYASDMPGLDLIGLGGYHDLPFARAAGHGLGASIELIERMPVDDRPDVMAIYPSWWEDLPRLFSRGKLASVTVEGNVICGAAEKVIYAADWRGLDVGERPSSLSADEEVIDDLDVADLVSEREHDFRFDAPASGEVALHLLPDPRDRRRDLFDAGRRLSPGDAQKARLRLPGDGRRARLVLRTAPTEPATISLSLAGMPRRVLRVLPAAGWVEISVELPAELPPHAELELLGRTGEWLTHHVWVVAPRSPRGAHAARGGRDGR